MTQDAFNRLCIRIYAAFGKSAYAENSTIQTFLFDRIGWIDDKYVDRIAAEIEMMDKMPSNIGTAILQVYYQFSDTDKKAKAPCSKCYKDSGYFWLVNPTYSAPNGYSVRCPFCNGGSVDELNYQLAKGSVKVPDTERYARVFWEKKFGVWERGVQ